MSPPAFEPIAVVGQSCILPDALDVATLWDNVLAGRSSITATPPGRWGLRAALALGSPERSADRSWSDRGGYVRGFECVFDPTGFALSADEVRALDPVFQMTLHGVREALRSGGFDGGAGLRAGLVMGNLSFPSASLARYAEAVWHGLPGSGVPPRTADAGAPATPHPRNRFSSGLPAHLAARALALSEGAFALDAACASSLYAIKLACDRLADGRADVMVAGAVNQADDLFIHVGFCALEAMSRSGRSRPFHRDADGLVPAEGAGFVVLQRLADAVAARRPILGVIRGIGLSNDGRGRGLLAPSDEGQERALREAYRLAGVRPADVGLIECHATGTPVGDATELASTARVFEGCQDVPIGSLKSNLGHLITVAGVAALQKVLAAMKHGVRPPTLHVDAPTSALARTPFRLLTAAEPWRGPLRAAVSAFGFGGNNAHLVVDAYEGQRGSGARGGAQALEAAAVARQAPAAAPRVAIVAVGARVGVGHGQGDLTVGLFSGAPQPRRREAVEIELEGLRFPPKDLSAALAQQTLLLEAAREAARGVSLPRERTAVLVGMGCDSEVARYGARWRLAEHAERWAAAAGGAVDEAWLAAARDAFVPVLEAPGVVGTMPNIPANRLNGQLDLAGPSFTVSAEEASGLVGLELAVRALRAKEIDAALVGAVDLSCEPVHEAALRALGVDAPSGDAAVVLVLRREDDALEAKEAILALVDELPEGGSSGAPGAAKVHREGASEVRWGERPLRLGDGPEALELSSSLGRAHAAHGLVHVAAAALALRHGASLRAGGPAMPWWGERRAEVALTPLSGEARTVRLRSVGRARLGVAPRGPARLHVYAGDDRSAALAALREGRPSGSGPARLVLVAAGDDELRARGEAARRWLEAGGPAPEGVAFCEAPVEGELAFVFTGGAAAYEGMGRELALAFPELVDRLAARCSEIDSATAWLYGPGSGSPAHPLDQLWGASFLCQLHAELSLGVLGLRPSAALGYSSGESNALFALGAWSDLGEMMRESRQGPMFTVDLVGEFAAPRRAWRRLGVEGGAWAGFSVAAPLAEVRRALEGEALAHLTIVNTPEDCVIAGERGACLRVVDRLGRHRALPLAYEMVAHAPELEEVRDAWWRLHHRATRDVPGVRFYASGGARAYRASAQAAADAITAQAVATMDFARVVEQAWADGVRVFVEHGPRGACSGWIRRVLGERPHLAVPLDVAGRGDLRQTQNAAAWLVAAGVSVNWAALESNLSAVAPKEPARGTKRLVVPAHPPAPRLPPLQATLERLPRAPVLAPVLGSGASSAAPLASAAPEAGDAPTPGRAEARLAEDAAPPSWRPSVPRPGEAPGADSPLAWLVAQQARMAETHRAFLAAQASAHERYLAFQDTATAALLGAARVGAAALGGAGPRATAEGSAAASLSLSPGVAASSAGAVARAVPGPRSDTRGAEVAASGAPGPGPVTGATSAARSSAERSAAPPAAVSAERPRDAGRAAKTARTSFPGPRFDRAQLETLAGGAISSVFGPAFATQDAYARQVRMPEPPLLLADRVLGIDAVPGSMGLGTIWTETDVRGDAWYASPEGRMPAGVMIEAGQADLLLISWLGVDAHNRGERVYRLLGCELTYHGALPRPGETLRYEISVDGHAQQGDVRLFFFHYGCTVGGVPRLSVRSGQAGFFTDEELAASAGVLWDCAGSEPRGSGRVDAPVAVCRRSRLGPDALRAFSEGRSFDCFGPGFELAQCHVRSPRISAGPMLFLHEVTELDVRGGPWGRGYLRAESPVSPTDWYFEGHFKNDPCMPGTLMFEGCLQAMSVYLASLGFTLERDGWRFEPVPEEPYALRCRGQVTPASRRLVYEVFVSEVIAGPEPTVYADLLCTVDGRKAFHARRVGLRLVPDWPMEQWKHLGGPATQTGSALVPLRSLGGLVGHLEPKPVAVVDGFAFDYHSLLACAWGPPSAAFGPFYARFDGARRAARLPGPPYHFMSRVTRVDGPLGGMKPGTRVEVEYDVPVEQWYFEENGARTMPFCVVMEAALQPCGWLASYVGSALRADVDLLFRNLDGTGTLAAEIFPSAGTFRTVVELLNVSQSAGMIIESFAVECFVGDTRVFDMKTVFGFFPKEAFENQVGLPSGDAERARLAATSDYRVDLTASPARFCEGSLRLAGPMLRMIDRVTGYWPDGGKARLGVLRAEKDVVPSEWFFKAHFFQDPVQPGSLGVEALCQLLQFFMIERGLGRGLSAPRFEPLRLGAPVTWKYRGQVTPRNALITTELEIVELGEDARGPYAVAEGSLWVDGKRIYQTSNLGMRIVEGRLAPRLGEAAEAPTDRAGALSGELAPARAVTAPVARRAVGTAPAPPAAPSPVDADAPEEFVDPSTPEGAWLADHCPTWTVPTFPMASIVDRLIAAAGARAARAVTALTDVRVHRWLPVSGRPLRLRTSVEAPGPTLEAAGSSGPAPCVVRLEAFRHAADPALSRFEVVASAVAHFDAREREAPLAPLADAEPTADPYESGALFHGPAFQYLTELRLGEAGSTAWLDAARGRVPRGAVHQGLLDAATHGIPHDALWRWAPTVGRSQVGYPARLERLVLYEPLPSEGTLRAEARFAGFAGGDERFPQFDVQLVRGERVLLALRLVDALFPAGPIGAAPREARRAFLQARSHVPGLGLSEAIEGGTRLTAAALAESDWLPGTVAQAYGLERGVPAAELLAQVAAKDHLARRLRVHPSEIDVAAAGALWRSRPLTRHPLEFREGRGEVSVRDGGPPFHDLSLVKDAWRRRLGMGEWLVEDLFTGLVDRFVGEVVLEDEAAFRAVAGRSCLYLGNHQVGIESLLFSMLAGALSGVPTVTLAKAEHRTSWLGTLIARSFSYPGVEDPGVIAFFDREDKEALLRVVGELGEEMRRAGKSVMVHVEGTRSLACRQPVLKMSSAFLDLALQLGAPVVPVRFVGGLPVTPLKLRLEFPVASGRQDYWIGRPILPEQLAGMPLKERKGFVIAALNSLGPPLMSELPAPGDAAFGEAVEAWHRSTGTVLEDAVLYAILQALRTPGPETRALLEGAARGVLRVGADQRSQWLGRMARRLFGPRGPRVEGLETVAEGATTASVL